MAPFCVPGLTFRKAASCFKLLKTRDLPLLANKMHNDNEGRIDMNNQLSVETAVCSEHQRLLAECEQALDNWNDHRAEFCKSYPIGKEAGDELVRLQAKYARAYTVLRNHEHNCLLCQLVSTAEERDSENSSDGYFDSIL